MSNAIAGKSWVRTDDKYCHRPTFDIKCRYCGGPMFLRFSELGFDDKYTGGVKTYINHVCYKCPDCAWIARFDVWDEPAYLLGILKLRGNAMHFQPDAEEWCDESEQIARQLEGLGYIGGRAVEPKA